MADKTGAAVDGYLEDPDEPGSLGYDNDGEKITEVTHRTPVWGLQIRKWIVTPDPDALSAPKAGWKTLRVLERQPWAEPDPMTVADLGAGRYEWRVRTTRAIAGQVRFAKRGEFPGVPPELPASGVFNITPSQAAQAARLMGQPIQEADEPMEPDLEPSPVRTLTRERAAEPTSPLTPSAIGQAVATAVNQALQGASTQPNQIERAVAAALDAQRLQDLAREVGTLREALASKASALELQKVASKAEEALRDAAKAGQDAFAALEEARKSAKAKTEAPPLEAQVDGMLKIAERFGLKRLEQATPAPVGRTGVDLAADMGARVLTLADNALRTRGVIRENPLVRDAGNNNGNGKAQEAGGGDVGKIDWRTFRGGQYAHVGPWVERLADDIVGDTPLQVGYLVTDAVMRLHKYPAECEAVLAFKPDEVRDLVAYAKGSNHPLAAGWTAEDAALIADFQAAFRDRLARFRADAAARAKAETEAAKRAEEERQEAEAKGKTDANAANGAGVGAGAGSGGGGAGQAGK